MQITWGQSPASETCLLTVVVVVVASSGSLAYYQYQLARSSSLNSRMVSLQRLLFLIRSLLPYHGRRLGYPNIGDSGVLISKLVYTNHDDENDDDDEDVDQVVIIIQPAKQSDKIITAFNWFFWLVSANVSWMNRPVNYVTGGGGGGGKHLDSCLLLPFWPRVEFSPKR